jgi:hypothetical protein
MIQYLHGFLNISTIIPPKMLAAIYTLFWLVSLIQSSQRLYWGFSIVLQTIRKRLYLCACRLNEAIYQSAGITWIVRLVCWSRHVSNDNQRVLKYSAYSINEVPVNEFYDSKVQKNTLQRIKYPLTNFLIIRQQSTCPDNEVVKDFVVRKDNSFRHSRFEKWRFFCFSGIFFVFKTCWVLQVNMLSICIIYMKLLAWNLSLSFFAFFFPFLTNYDILHESLWERGILQRIFGREIIWQRFFFHFCSIMPFT